MRPIDKLPLVVVSGYHTAFARFVIGSVKDRMKWIKIIWLLVISVLLVACSSEQKNGVSPATIASVNAGQDINVLEGVAFSLTAQVYPEGGVATWVQTHGPVIENFPVEPALSLQLMPPTVNVDSTLTFEVTYTATDGQQVKDTVNVFVQNVNAKPVAIIKAADDVVPPYQTYDIVTLTAEDSYDSDGEIRQYAWRQVDSNAPLRFTSDVNSVTVSFEAPLVASLTNYKLQLTVTDNFEASQTNIYDVLISAAGVSIAANAGEDQMVDEFTLVVLDGSASVATNSTLTCQWQQLAGTIANLNDSNECIANFIAPDVDSEDLLSFELTVSDALNNTATDTVSVTVGPLNLGKLHDTGVTECFDNTGVIDCGSEQFPSQDADHGRDSVADVIDKSGQGPQAFDFTKFDERGDELDDQNGQVFSCVRDNFTGLIWEVKTEIAVPQFSTLRGAENYYSYDDSATALSSCPSNIACGLDTYISDVNQSAYCGANNWRLPSYMELLSIMNYQDLNDDFLLPREFFPYSPNRAALGHKFFWTANGSAESGGDLLRWVLDLSTGDDSAILPSKPAYILLVRTP